MIWSLLLACSTSTETSPDPSPQPEAAPDVAPEPAKPAPSQTTGTKAPALPKKLEDLPLRLGTSNAEMSYVTAQLGFGEADLNKLYPTQTNVPAFYDKPASDGAVHIPPTLIDSIVLFTTASLQADGFTDITVRVDPGTTYSVAIEANGPNLADYAVQLPAFLQAGMVGYNGWEQCLQDPAACGGKTVTHACTNNSAGDDKQCPPWAFYLPFGQPLVNHYGVMLLNYPPDDALCSADYQNNFTMNRWNQVLGWSVEPTIYWSGIVDVHPIAAAGSGESHGIEATTKYFDDYWKAMLEVVTTPPNIASRPGFTNSTISVMVSGGPAHDVWGAAIGQDVDTNDLGKTTVLDAPKNTAWVATNHPDVATYNCCKGDTSESCCDGTYAAGSPPTCTGGYGWSWDLYDDEVSDFQNACYFENISLNPDTRFEDYGMTCLRGIQWGEPTFCVQGRQDYQFTTARHCNCKAAAQLLCATTGENLCNPTTCEEANVKAGCPTRTDSYVECASL